PSFNGEALAAEYRRNPHKVRAFLQALGSVRSPDMLIMVWRVLQGMGIASVQLDYQSEEAFRLRIRLSSPHESQSLEEYESDDIKDAAVLRHFGTTNGAGGRPVYSGFYALNLQPAGLGA